MFVSLWMTSIIVYFLFYLYMNFKIINFESPEEAEEYLDGDPWETPVFLFITVVAIFTTFIATVKFFTNTLF